MADGRITIDVVADTAKLGGVASGIAAIGGAAGLAAGAVGGLGIAMAALAAPAAAIVGTIAVGASGVADAFKAVSESAANAGKEAAAQNAAIASAAKQVATAQRQVRDTSQAAQDADRGLADAHKDVESAQKDLTRAFKDGAEQIEDLKFAAEDAALSEKEAAHDLTKARKELAKTGRDAKATADDRKDAAIRVERAELRLRKAQDANRDAAEASAEATAKGVEGSDAVVRAQDKVAKASEGVAAAERRVQDARERAGDAQAQLAEAQNALAAANNQTSASAQKAADALAKLAPSAQAFVLTLQELSPQFTEFRKQVQQPLFEGLAEQMRGIADNVLPVLGQGMAGIAAELNAGAHGFANFLQSSQGLDGLKAALGGASDLIKGMREGSDGFLASLARLSVEAQPFMEGIGRAFGSIGTQIGKAFNQLAESGSLDKIFAGFQSTIEAVGPLLGSFLQNIGQIAATVLPAVAPVLSALSTGISQIAGPLGDLGKQLAQTLADVLPHFTGFLAQIGEGLRPILPVLGEVLKSLFAALTPLIDPLSQFLRILGNTLVETINALAPAIQPLAEAILSLFRALAPIIPLIAEGLANALVAIAPALTTVFDALAPVIRQLAEQMRPVMEQLAPILAETAAILGQALADAITQLAPYIPQLVQSFAQLVLAVAPLLPELAKLAATVLPPLIQLFLESVPAILKIIDTMTWLVENVVKPLMIPWLKFLGQILTETFDNIRVVIDFFQRKLGETIDVITGWWDKLSSGIGKAKDVIVNDIFPAFGRAIDGVKEAFRLGVDAIGTVWNGLKSILAKPINAVIDVVYNNGIKKAWNGVAEFLNIPGRLPEISKIPEAFATGGFVRGPGGPKDDKIPAWLSNGEYVLPANVVSRVGVTNLDRFIKSNGPSEGLFGRLGFASGGAVVIEDAMKRAHRFARGEAGKPYQYGGFGNPSWDCSGIWSGVYNVLQGRKPTDGVRFTTENLEQYGFVPGLRGPVTVGVMRGGGGALSHMAGTLQGTNVESDGANGVQYGGTADGSHQFPLQFTLTDFEGLFKKGIDGGSGGGLFGGIANFFRNRVVDLFEKPVNAIIDALPSSPQDIAKSFARKIADGFFDYLRGKSGEQDNARGADPHAPGGGAEQWRPLAMRALAATGYTPPDQFVEAMLKQIQSESGGNPSIVQTVQDVNSGGNEGVGLLQIIPGTFAAYRDPSLPNDRTDPYANMVAALRYVRDRYQGDINGVWGHGHGYMTGGFIPGAGIGDIIPAMLEPGEFVVNRKAVARFGPMIAAMNRGVPRFQTGGIVDGTVAAGSLPVVLESAAGSVISAIGDAVGGVINQVFGDVVKAAVDTLTREAPAREEKQELTASESGELAQTSELAKRSESSVELVIQERMREVQAAVNEVTRRLVPEALVPIVQDGTQQALGIVEAWLTAGFKDVTKGTDRTTRAVENLDGGAGAPPFGAPGSAFDAAAAISDAVVSVANTAKSVFEKVGQDIVNKALEQTPSRVDNPRGVLGRDISGGFLVDLIVRLTGVEIEIGETMIDTLEEIRRQRGDDQRAFDETGRIIGATAELMQRNESSREKVIAEQERIFKALLKAVLKYIVGQVILPILAAILGALVTLAAAAVGGAIGGPIGAAIGALIGAALGGLVTAAVTAIGVAAAAGIEGFDAGGVAHGVGFMPKNTIEPERVLSPRQTRAFEEFVARMPNGGGGGSKTVNAPVTVLNAGPDTGSRISNDLLTYINS